MVGREAETLAMADAVKRVTKGEGREVVLVSGEAGLGKTTLVAEAARAAFEDGACVLFGHCEEDLATPYQLFAEALGHYVTHAPEDQLLAHVATHGSELARLVPALARRIPDLPPPRPPTPTPSATCSSPRWWGCWPRRREHQPVVLVLDDLQWADKGSLLLLRHLAGGRPGPCGCLILGTYRDSELAPCPRAARDAGRAPPPSGVTRIELAGLDDPGVVSYMEAAAGHDLDDDGVGLAHAVYRETDGNPFFVSEVLRHLSETGAIYPGRHRPVGGRGLPRAMALPDSVREVIGARVVRLGQDAERVLSMAAVIGRDFDLDLLARATETTEDELLDILERPPPWLWCGSWPTPRGVTASPTPSSSTPCTRIWAHTAGPGPTARWPRPWRTCAADRPGAGWANWPGTGSRPPTGRPDQGHRLLPSGGRRRPGRPGPGRRAALLRPGPRPLPPGRRPRSRPRHRPGHRTRHGPTPDRGPRLPGDPARCRPPGGRAR